MYTGRSSESYRGLFLQVEKMSLHPSPVKIDTKCSFLLRKIGGSLKKNYNLKFPAQ